MEVQQQINFALKERFEKENIVFAYPTQTVYLNNNNNEVTKSYVINNKVL
jgi:small-conductance mechanosensitive channel